MTPEQKSLYTRICQFELDDPWASFPFSVKLAWEYQWSAFFGTSQSSKVKDQCSSGLIASITGLFQSQLLYCGFREYLDKLHSHCGQGLQQY